MPDRRPDLETIKRESGGLAGSIATGLAGDTPAFDGTDGQLLKFHGVYQQDDRDLRVDRKRSGRGRAHSFMVRSKIPGGRLTAEQYIAHDSLAERFGNGTLRITVRQDLQLHGVIKRHLRRSLRSINRTLLTTFGACGDVVRNIMCCPVPPTDPVRQEIERLADRLTDHFLPHTPAYHEIWLDGERLASESRTPVDEPIYGAAYLPRKFKIAIAAPEDDCVEVRTHDLGLVALADGEQLLGFNLWVGGGLGMTHRKPNTFPRLADPLGFVEAPRALEVVERVVRVQRDHGDREDRRHARLKYLIHDRGLAWFRRQVEQGLGYALDPPRLGPRLRPRLHLGWHEQRDGHWRLGLSVENGRIVDAPGVRLRSGLRALVERFRPDVRLTPHQDLLLCGLAAEDREAVTALLAEHRIPGVDELPRVRTHAMACPALPTCGLALAEAERALPAILVELQRELARLGLDNEALAVRMTGCPNGCARPYVADLAFVGRSADRYVVYVGGSRGAERLNRPYLDLVHRDDLVPSVAPLLEWFRAARAEGESFGDFCDRVGVQALHAWAAASQRVDKHA